MQAKNGSGCTQEPPHQEMDRKEPQPPTLFGREERRGEEENTQDLGNKDCERQITEEN